MYPRLFVVFLVAILTALAPTASIPASAHVFLFKSVPADGDQLTVAPDQMTAEFTSDLYPDGSVLVLLSADGTQLDNGDTVIDPDNPKRLVVTLRPLAPGDYTAQWTAVDAIDGHMSDGSFSFSVLP